MTRGTDIADPVPDGECAGTQPRIFVRATDQPPVPDPRDQPAPPSPATPGRTADLSAPADGDAVRTAAQQAVQMPGGGSAGTSRPAEAVAPGFGNGASAAAPGTAVYGARQSLPGSGGGSTAATPADEPVAPTAASPGVGSPGGKAEPPTDLGAVPPQAARGGKTLAAASAGAPAEPTPGVGAKAPTRSGLAGEAPAGRSAAGAAAGEEAAGGVPPQPSSDAEASAAGAAGAAAQSAHGFGTAPGAKAPITSSVAGEAAAGPSASSGVGAAAVGSGSPGSVPSQPTHGVGARPDAGSSAAGGIGEAAARTVTPQTAPGAGAAHGVESSAARAAAHGVESLAARAAAPDSAAEPGKAVGGRAEQRRGKGLVVSPRALRFAALGDSLTSGVGDPVDGGWRGWAALLGGALGPARAAGAGAGGESPVRFHNFAVSGALTRDVEEQQVPAVLDFGPDIASVVVGVNDTLRCAFDIQDIAQRLDRACAALAARGAVLLTTCLPDPGSMLGLPLPLARPLARRQRALNAVVHALAARYDTIHLHMADAAWVGDRSLWSADRLHPGERGHRMIAARFHAPLAARGLAIGPPPSLEADQSPPSRAAVMLWLATKGAGWVARRCQDLLPELLRLAGDEVRHWARGTSARLDAHAEQALSRALATLSPLSSPLAPLSPGVPLARMGE